MQEGTGRRLKLAVVFYSYGGNGGISSEVPDIRHWWERTLLVAKKDERIEDEIITFTIADTPITAQRNKSVLIARQAKVDVLIMVDSDQKPDCELGSDPSAKPFFESSFDFLYKHFDKGPSVICAPYCGPPPFENVYVFRWGHDETASPDNLWHIDQYSREEAELMTGITPVAAQPTGLIMWDMRAFELTDPKHAHKALMEQGLADREAKSRVHSWFYYEYADLYESEKCSTEDVTATRDISLHGLLKLGYSPIYCNWDAWAGHWKPKCVRKPRCLKADHIEFKYREAVRRGVDQGERIVTLTGFPDAEEGSGEAAGKHVGARQAAGVANGRRIEPAADGGPVRESGGGPRGNGQVREDHCGRHQEPQTRFAVAGAAD